MKTLQTIAATILATSTAVSADWDMPFFGDDSNGYNSNNSNWNNNSNVSSSREGEFDSSFSFGMKAKGRGQGRGNGNYDNYYNGHNGYNGYEGYNNAPYGYAPVPQAALTQLTPATVAK